jgi:Rhodanase C-terminal
LKGGIQRYLEQTVAPNFDAAQSDEEVKTKIDGGTGTNGSTNNTTCYFRGKNFVFDQRRTDPMFDQTNFKNEADCVVGRCIACHSVHDDYDNGHAPFDNKEARCNTCRMLVLVCNYCRPKFVCHGEERTDDDLRPRLFCNLSRCGHEGSTPELELVGGRESDQQLDGI